MAGWLYYLQQVISIIGYRLDALLLLFIIQWGEERTRGVPVGLLSKSVNWTLQTSLHLHPVVQTILTWPTSCCKTGGKKKFLAGWTTCPAKNHAKLEGKIGNF